MKSFEKSNSLSQVCLKARTFESIQVAIDARPCISKVSVALEGLPSPAKTHVIDAG
jgi:hypothetical protein